MKKHGLLNTDIVQAIAQAGHGQSLTVADAGLPISLSCRRIDISVKQGLPGFIDVVSAVLDEMDVERAIIAAEIVEQNPEVLNRLQDILGTVPIDRIPHEEFKKRAGESLAIIRTGEVTPYANVILVAGVASVFKNS